MVSKGFGSRRKRGKKPLDSANLLVVKSARW